MAAIPTVSTRRRRLTPFDRCVLLIRASSDPTRMRILLLLADGELCLCQLTAVLDLAASTVSEHLRRLREAGLVTMRREGKWRFYGLPDAFQHEAAASFVQWLLAEAKDDTWLREKREAVRKIRCTPPDELTGN